MKIFDCVTYFDESLQVDLRFNVLNNYIEKFVICESVYDHKGKYKGVNFNIENYKKMTLNFDVFIDKHTNGRIIFLFLDPYIFR